MLRGARPTGSSAVALTRELRDWVGEQLGPIAKPDDIRFADNLPKTRSGKIMRRLLRAVANDEEVTQDVSTLENPAILDQLRGKPSKPAAAPKAKAAARAKAPAKATAKKKPARARPRRAAKARKAKARKAPKRAARKRPAPRRKR